MKLLFITGLWLLILIAISIMTVIVFNKLEKKTNSELTLVMGVTLFVTIMAAVSVFGLVKMLEISL